MPGIHALGAAVVTAKFDIGNFSFQEQCRCLLIEGELAAKKFADGHADADAARTCPGRRAFARVNEDARRKLLDQEPDFHGYGSRVRRTAPQISETSFSDGKYIAVLRVDDGADSFFNRRCGE